jgi:hypothetical protein
MDRAQSDLLFVEWSAPRSADHNDPETWRQASAHFDARRMERMSKALAAAVSPRQLEAFRRQWLNQWPDLARTAQQGWPMGWDSCEAASEAPPPGAVAALEVSLDRSVYGFALVAGTGQGMAAWSGQSGSLVGALAALERWAPSLLLAGMSLRDHAPGPWVVEGVGLAQTRLATPVLADVVARGMLTRHPDPVLDAEVAAAKVAELEGGSMLSAKRSQGPVPTLKALCWAVWAVECGVFNAEAPQVW